jgi:hypothetical protein
MSLPYSTFPLLNPSPQHNPECPHCAETILRHWNLKHEQKLFDLCSKNQLDALFILSLFLQSTSTCFGLICSPSSGYMQYTSLWWRTAMAQWLRYCATNRKVAGTIPDGVIGIFHWRNPSDRTMALGSTQPLTALTEMSTRRISWG